MNLALSTIILFVLLLPGIVFRKFYYSEEFSREYFKSSVFEVFISALLPSIFLHICWFYLVRIFNYNVDFTILGDLISSNPNTSSFENIQENHFNIFLYNFTMLISSGALGLFSKRLIRFFKLDREIKQFRFKNVWHYILKGEFFDFPRAAFNLENDKLEDIEVVYVDALVDTSKGPIIYDGILVDYELSDEGGLESITLKQVQRRWLHDEGQLETSDKYYVIPGHILILKYSEILNLNFSYYKIIMENEALNVEMVN